jgi:lipid-binding SYLF domain-containing protein
MFKKITFLVTCIAIAMPAFSEDKVEKRLSESTAVLDTILTKQDIPKSILDKSRCVVVYPGVRKVGVGVGVTYGRGVLGCRTGKNMAGPWSAPIMYTLDTGSIGAQLGSTSTDYVLLVVTERGANKLLSGKLKVGADAAAVAGPKSANAVGANDPNTDIVAYSQAKGLFAGASLGSASMEFDKDANKELYKKQVDPDEIVRDNALPVPPEAQGFVSALKKASPKLIK